MNNYIFTGKVISKLVLNKVNKKQYIYTTLIVPNDKKGIQYYKVIVLAKGQLAENIFQMYQKGDYVIVEGKVHTKKYKIKEHINKFIFLKVNNIYPTNNILNNFI